VATASTRYCSGRVFFVEEGNIYGEKTQGGVHDTPLLVDSGSRFEGRLGSGEDDTGVMKIRVG
jgi:hypothetical protein